MSLADRAERINASKPQLVADVMLYATKDGGRRIPALPGWGCPCMVDPATRVAWDAWPILGDTPLMPGDRRRLGFIFLTEDGLERMKSAGRFFLWEGRVIGEAVVVDDNGTSAVFGP